MQKRTINVFFLTMINLATILSVRNWPITAEYGLASLAYLFVAVTLFFIPASLVSAELATGWPHKGGVFVWVKEALGHKLGFLAVWLLWIENVVWYPLPLSFVAATFAYSFYPALAASRFYTLLVILATFWIFTYANLRGMRISGWISTVGVLIGTILPGIVIIAVGFSWYFGNNPSFIDFSLRGLRPDFSNIANLAFLAGILLSFCGMEMSAVHALDVKDPKRDYPRAIFLSGSLIIVLTFLGTIAIAILVPREQISLVSGGIEAIYVFFSSLNALWIIPILAILFAIGALGNVSTWIAGPCKGLLAAAEKGDFPPLLHKTNIHNMPVALMIMQAFIVSLLSIIVFAFMPDVSSAFWILTALASQLYLIMYVLMFISAIVLRYTRKEVQRQYKIPFGNFGMWVVALAGIKAAVFAIIVGFFPPTQIETGSLVFFELFLSLGIVIFCSIPFIILSLKNSRWEEKEKR